MLRDRITILLLGDIIALAASFVIMIAIRFPAPDAQATVALQTTLFARLFVMWLVVFLAFDLYNLRRINPNPRTIGLLAIAITTASLLSIAVFYLFPLGGLTPKTNLAIVAIAAFILIASWRRLFYKLFSDRFVQRIAVIGEGEALEHLLEDLDRHPHLGRVISVQRSYEGPSSIPDASIVIAHGVDVRGLISIAQEKRCEVFSLADAYEELLGKVPLTLMTEERAITALSQHQELHYRVFERLFEIIFSLLVLVIVSPFLLIAAIAILIEDGSPIIYTQPRVGKNGKLFSIYKLRSMTKTAESHGAQWATKGDTRVTKVGRVLRSTHLDEVPQMWNILRGDLALVGPRPERPEFVTQLETDVPYYFLRHTIKPGFTGWAQIKYRYASSVLDAREKLEYDLYYLLHKNPLFDLGIVVKTLQIIFTH